MSESGRTTNRPEYAPERRPGDPLDLEPAARELVAMHFYARDVGTIAALIEAGAAALKYAPGSASAAVELNARRSAVKLGSSVARAMRAELARRTAPAPTKRGRK